MKRARFYNLPLLRLLTYTHEGKFLFTKALIGSIINRSIFRLPAIITGLAINVFTQGPNKFLCQWHISVPLYQIYFLAFLTLFTYLSQISLYYYAAIGWRKLGQLIQHNLRIATFKHIQNLAMSYHENTSTGSLATLINEDANQIESFIDFGFDQIINAIVDIASTIIIFLFIKTYLIGIALIPIPIIIYAAYQMFIQCGSLQKISRQHASKIGEITTISAHGIETIKNYNGYGYQEKLLIEQSVSYKKALDMFNKTRFFYTNIMKCSVIISISCMIVGGGIEVIKGNLLIGTYTILINGIKQFLWPAHMICTIIYTANRTLESAKRLFDILDIPINNEEGSLVLSNEPPAIIFTNVSFAYSNKTPVFQCLSCTIPAGTSIALVGNSGTGKSTFGKLLLRLYEPSEGTITLNGHNIKDFRLDNLRSIITRVTQETFLFPGTIYDNITYGLSPEIISEEAVIKASSLARAHEFIAQLPLSYQTILGEGGHSLSGGQRQRIALARTLLRDTPVIILDEALSANEEEIEDTIYDRITREYTNKTIIIISHRSTVQRYVNTTLHLKKLLTTSSTEHSDGKY